MKMSHIFISKFVIFKTKTEVGYKIIFNILTISFMHYLNFKML